MKRTLKQLFNHKVRYPGSLSFYTVKVEIGTNAPNQKKLDEAFMDIIPGLEKYLIERGFVLETGLLTREDK